MVVLPFALGIAYSCALPFFVPCHAVPLSMGQDRSSIAFVAVSVVNETIAQWQEKNHIEVTPELRTIIADGFRGEDAFLRSTFEKKRLDDAGSEELLRSLVDSYLYELRDKKIDRILKQQKKVKLNKYAKTPPFVPPQWTTGAPIIKVGEGVEVTNLTVEDVRGYTVAKFLRERARMLESSTGRLVVTSQPDAASISIDGDEKGFTNKTFVVSAGEHGVSVKKKEASLDCDDKVSVPANTTKYFHCP
jgi:hypothetical protein